MGKAAEYIGKKFGYLTVVGISHKDKYGRSIYNTICDCGNTSTTRKDSLNNGTLSCGCYGKSKSTNKYERKVRLTTNQRNAKYINRYGITLDQYNQMFKDQNGLCKICNNLETKPSNYGEVRNLAVDHCHSTGKVRGLLCSDCNTSLGLVKDSVDTLNNMVKYLEGQK